MTEIPWVLWYGGDLVGCTRCRDRFWLPTRCSVTAFSAILLAYIDVHRDC